MSRGWNSLPGACSDLDIWAHISPIGRVEVMGNTKLFVKKKNVVQNQEKTEYLNQQNVTYRENIN